MNINSIRIFHPVVDKTLPQATGPPDRTYQSTQRKKTPFRLGTSV